MFALFIFLTTVIGPIIFWWYFFIWQDRCEPEPKKKLVKAFFLGIGVAIFAAVVEEIFSFGNSSEGILDLMSNLTLLGVFLLILFGVVEELGKLFAVWGFIYSKNYFNQIADGAFYAVTIAMGFIFIENSSYFYLLYKEETTVVFAISNLVRGVATALMHITSAGIIGYSFGKMKFTAGHSRKIISKGLLIAVSLHVSFNLLVSLEMIVPAFAITFGAFIYFLNLLKQKESKLVWKLIDPRKQ